MTANPRWLPDDGIVDPVAIRRATEGDRTITLTPRERAHAIDMLLARGETTRDIAVLLGCGERTVWRHTATTSCTVRGCTSTRWRREYCTTHYFRVRRNDTPGLSPQRGRPAVALSVTTLRTLRDAGWTPADVAAVAGVSPRTVYRALQRASA